MSAEIPGRVSAREIAEANEAVIAERDELRQQLAASQASEAVLRECVELYADEKHWGGWTGIRNAWIVIRNDSYEHGYEPAQAALRKVEELNSNERKEST